MRSAPDEAFRSRVLGEARARLEDRTRWRTDPERTSIHVEPITMPGTTMSPIRRRPLLLAAASVVLLALGVSGILALSGGEDRPDPTDTGRAGGVASPVTGTAPPTTSAVTTPPTLPPTTTAPPTVAPTTAIADDDPPHDIIGPAGPDDLMAAAALLDDRYLPDAFEAVSPAIGWAPGFDPAAARGTDVCTDFQASVFGAMFTAATAARSYSASVDGTLVVQQQFVAVFGSDDFARTTFDALSGPAFIDCAQVVGIGRDGVPTGLASGTPVDAPFTPIGVEQLQYRTWTADDGAPQQAAIIRSGRMIAYLDAPGVEQGHPRDVAPEEFRSLLATIVELRAGSEADLATVESVLLPAEEYGTGWASTEPTDNLGSEFVPAYAREIPECIEFADSVFQMIYELPHAISLYYRPYPEGAIGQYAAIFPDDESAAAMMATLHSAAFAPCATAYQRYVLGSNCCNGGPLLPAAFDQPAVEPPFGPIGDQLVYRRYEASWTGPNREVHGPELLLDASVRVGRIVSFIGTLGEGDGTGDGGRDVVVTTDEQFALTLGNVERRARDALAALEAG